MGDYCGYPKGLAENLVCLLVGLVGVVVLKLEHFVELLQVLLGYLLGSLMVQESIEFPEGLVESVSRVLLLGWRIRWRFLNGYCIVNKSTYLRRRLVNIFLDDLRVEDLLFKFAGFLDRSSDFFV